jgi:endonuclease/exonuclease/phosphatase family metal-dependent hydrolase
MKRLCHLLLRRSIPILFLALATTAWAATGTIRIASYNIDDDTGGAGGVGPQTPFASLGTVLKGIGDHHLAGNAQPIDVLLLQELHYDNPSLSSSLPQVVAQLNAAFPGNTYVADTFVDPTNGNLTGNGPSGMIYNSTTMSEFAVTVGVGPAPSGSGSPRQPVRHALRPIGFAPGVGDFYIYNVHAKAGSVALSSQNPVRRNIEAQNVRANADALGSAAHVIYGGDWNIDAGSTEAAYVTLTAAGNGQAHDLGDPSQTWFNDAAHVGLMNWDNTSLQARDDLMLINTAMQTQNGLKYVAGSFETFGNNGSVALNGTVDSAGNTALADLANRTTILNLLTQVSDHLPIVADFAVVVPEPASFAGMAIFCGVLVARRRRAA